MQTEKKKKYKNPGCIVVFRTMTDVYDGTLFCKNITATAVNYFHKNPPS